MPPNPDLALLDPGKAEIGRRRRSSATGARLRRVPPPLPRARPPNRPILDLRPRLDPKVTKSKPSDPNPMAQNLRYWFSLSHLLKRPWVFLELTRRPSLFKSIYKPVLFYSPRPLSFLDFEPAVQPLFFCELDPRTKV